jgi:hypothetical protein
MSTDNHSDQALTKHLHIVLDDATYQRLRAMAFTQQTSLGDVVRQALLAHFATEQAA